MGERGGKEESGRKEYIVFIGPSFEHENFKQAPLEGIL